MKILIWTQYFWPENFHINEVVAELQKQGMNVTVLTGKPNYPDGNIFTGYRASGVQIESQNGVEIIRLPLRARGMNSSKSLALNYLSFIISGYVFGPRVLNGRDFDIIFVYAPSPLLQALPAILVSWIKKAPLVLWVQDIWPESLQATGYIKSSMALKLVEFLVRYIYRCSDLILIQSEGFRDSVQRLSKNWSRINFFPNSASEVEKDSCSLDVSCIAQKFSVVFAGNIGVAQSCITILEAAQALQEYKDIRFFLVGSGSMAGEISQSVHDRKINNVELFGRVSPDEIRSIYAASSVLLLTLRDDPIMAATVPSKFQSYLAAGKPIIASCNGQTAQVLSDAEAGLSCAAENSLQLAEAVLKLYGSDQESLDRMGRNGRSFFLKNFYLPVRVAQLIEHFACLVKKIKS